MSFENLAFLVAGLMGGGLITLAVQHLYSREPTRLLKRIDSRGRAEFIEKRDLHAQATEGVGGTYAVKFTEHLETSVRPSATLSARVVRADGTGEELGRLQS